MNRIFGDDRQDTFVNDGLLREAILGSIGELLTILVNYATVRQ